MFRFTKKFLQMLYLYEKVPQVKLNTYYGVRFLSSKEIGFLENANSSDILLQNLKSAPTTKSVLETVSAHRLIMNNKHIMQAFRSLFYLRKYGKSDLSTNEILDHPDFKALCLSLKYKIRTIDTNELIEALKILFYIGIPSDSTIIQLILQLIRHEINNLNLNHMIFLVFLLKQAKSTPLSDALLIALPIIFDIQLPMKMDRENISSLTDSLQFAAKHKISDGTVDCIIDAIMLHKSYDIKTAISIAWSLCDLKPREKYNLLMQKALKQICEHTGEFNILELETILTKLAYRYNMNYTFYYNKQFFDLIAEHVIQRNLGFQQTLWILQKFIKVGYFSNNILDYLATICHNNINLVIKTNPWNLFTIVTAFANSDYKPAHWEYIRQAILENKSVYDAKNDFNWIKFATRLAILDIYIPKVLEKCFDEDYVGKIIHRDNLVSCQHFLILYQTITTQHPEYISLLPDVSYVDKASKCMLHASPEYSPLQASLETGFGGKSYVLTNVLTKSGHLLHHVVIMRKGGYPVAFNITDDKPVILENLQYPSDCHIIAVFGCGSLFYKRNSYVLKTLYSLMMRTIETNGYSTVTIPLEMWLDLPDYEKIPYLMQTIRTKNEEFDKVSLIQ